MCFLSILVLAGIMRTALLAPALALLVTLVSAQNGTAPSNGTATCQADALDMHNWLRAIHQAPNLTWSDRLANDAQAWATHLADSGCAVEYALSTTDGEIVASLEANAGTRPCSVATVRWYMNGVVWKYTTQPSADNKELLAPSGLEGKARPFTQVVWAGSRQIGCAAVEGATGCWSVVCRYAPAGIRALDNTRAGLPLSASDAALTANVKPPVAPANLTATATCNTDTLAVHNKHRAAHLSPPISWDPALAIGAQAWAMVVARQDCRPLRSGRAAGERGRSGAGSFDCPAAAEADYSGVLEYAFTDTPWTDNGGQVGLVRTFINMVLAANSKLGCGLVVADQADCWVSTCWFGDYAGEWNDTFLLANVKPMQAPMVSTEQRARQEAALTLNNQYRAAHGAPPLTWSDQYAVGAQSMLYKPSFYFTEDTSTGAIVGYPGQLAFVTNSSGANNDTILNMAIAAWYTAGNASYKFTPTPYTDNKGLADGDGPAWMFSQVIWATSKQIGCGSTLEDGSWWAVCMYGPPGNTPQDSDYLQNVLPLGGIQVTAQSSPPVQSSPPPESSSSTPVGVIVGVCVGVGVALLAAVIGAVWWYRRGRQQRKPAADDVWASVGSPKDKALSLGAPDSTMSGLTGTTGHNTFVVMTPGTQHSSQALATAMTLPGLTTGEAFTRATAFAYSWNDTYTPVPGVTQAVESGVNDVQLDSMVQSSGGTVQDCPVLSLSKQEVQQQLQLLTAGLLGRGGAALVFKALWPSRFGPDALLAVKVLKDGYDSNPYILQSFAHEASVLASVRHPNVVRLYGYCLEPPNVCLVMELLPGSLKQVLYGMKGVASTTTGPAITGGGTSQHSTSSHGNSRTETSSPSLPIPPASSLQPADASTSSAAPLTMAQVLKYSTDIAAGLAYLHEQPEQPITLADGQAVAPLVTLAETDSGLTSGPGQAISNVSTKIVHRDLKPANILINSRDVAKITDFGLARRHDTTTIETRHVGAGTVPYQAPEVLSGAQAGAYGLKATNRCDIYSMAMIMWELLAKQPPWHGKSEMAILGAVVHGRRPELPAPQAEGPADVDLSQLPASLSALPAFNDIIRQCWAQREQRRPTAGELYGMLSALQHRLAGTAATRVQVTLLDGAPK